MCRINAGRVYCRRSSKGNERCRRDFLRSLIFPQLPQAVAVKASPVVPSDVLLFRCCFDVKYSSTETETGFYKLSVLDLLQYLPLKTKLLETGRLGNNWAADWTLFVGQGENHSDWDG